MAKLPENFVIGDRSDINSEQLLILFERMYRDLAIAINKKPDFYVREVDGDTSESFLPIASININKTTNKVEMLTNHTNPTTVVWTTLS